MAARSNADVLDMVFWFNALPKEGQNYRTVPSNQIFKCDWRLPGSHVDSPARKREGGDLSLGDTVFVKPPAARCTTSWPVGVVTDVGSDLSVEVNGIPRHMADLRKVPSNVSESEDGDDNGADVDAEGALPEQRPQRNRSRPNFYGNNIYDT